MTEYSERFDDFLLQTVLCPKARRPGLPAASSRDRKTARHGRPAGAEHKARIEHYIAIVAAGGILFEKE